MAALPPEDRRTGAAFGTLDCGYEVLGVEGGSPSARTVLLDLAYAPLGTDGELPAGGGVSVRVDDEGYLLTAPGLGAHKVSAGGEAVLSFTGPADIGKSAILLTVRVDDASHSDQ